MFSVSFFSTLAVNRPVSEVLGDRIISVYLFLIATIQYLMHLCLFVCLSVCLFKAHCLCCLRRVYSLPNAEGYVPPVHHSATIGLMNDLWSLSCQENEHEKVSV